eukprot:Rmarinus@m.30012
MRRVLRAMTGCYATNACRACSWQRYADWPSPGVTKPRLQHWNVSLVWILRLRLQSSTISVEIWPMLWPMVMLIVSRHTATPTTRSIDCQSLKQPCYFVLKSSLKPVKRRSRMLPR